MSWRDKPRPAWDRADWVASFMVQDSEGQPCPRCNDEGCCLCADDEECRTDYMARRKGKTCGPCETRLSYEEWDGAA